MLLYFHIQKNSLSGFKIAWIEFYMYMGIYKYANVSAPGAALPTCLQLDLFLSLLQWKLSSARARSDMVGVKISLQGQKGAFNHIGS